MYYTIGNNENGIFLQVIANGTNFVNETTFDNFPEFQRIHNVDGSFAHKSKQFANLLRLKIALT